MTSHLPKKSPFVWMHGVPQDHQNLHQMSKNQNTSNSSLLLSFLDSLLEIKTIILWASALHSRSKEALNADKTPISPTLEVLPSSSSGKAFTFRNIASRFVVRGITLILGCLLDGSLSLYAICPILRVPRDRLNTTWHIFSMKWEDSFEELSPFLCKSCANTISLINRIRLALGTMDIVDFIGMYSHLL